MARPFKIARGQVLPLQMSATAGSVAEQLGFAREVATKSIVDALSLDAAEEFAGSVGSVTPFVGQAAHVAWVSSLQIPHSAGSGYSADWLSAWNGPLVSVPHLLMRMDVVDGDVELMVNLLPRADGAYHTRLPDGSYPEPDSRKAFEKAGMRREFGESFLSTAEATAWRDELLGTPGLELRPTSLPDVCVGPLLVDARLPLSQAGAAVRAVEGATAAWLGWMDGAEELKQIKSMLAFAHDCKVRPRVHALTLTALEARFGPAGRELALVDAGPIDMSDRGGAMADAAADNWKDAGSSTKYAGFD
jgi:hypothetical protein